MGRRSLPEWALDRWYARRYDEQRGYGYPRWWRAREARRLSRGAPVVVVRVRPRDIPPEVDQP